MAVWISIYFTQVFILAWVEYGFEIWVEIRVEIRVEWLDRWIFGCGALLIDYKQIKHFQSYRTFNSENA